nr:proteasome subunit alpha type-3-like [Ipomoea batatas]
MVEQVPKPPQTLDQKINALAFAMEGLSTRITNLEQHHQQAKQSQAVAAADSSSSLSVKLPPKPHDQCKAYMDELSKTPPDKIKTCCRPFGCGVILGGYDRDGPQLYMVEPSGISYLCLVMVSLSSLGKMCDAYTPAGEPIPTNKSHNAAKIFSNPEVAMEEPWYQDFCCAIVV